MKQQSALSSYRSICRANKNEITAYQINKCHKNASDDTHKIIQRIHYQLIKMITSLLYNILYFFFLSMSCKPESIVYLKIIFVIQSNEIWFVLDTIDMRSWKKV